MKKAGRNDPCPCGSGKKYKSCCANKDRPARFRKINAKVITTKEEKEPVDLMGRAFGDAIIPAKEDEKPPVPPESPPGTSS